MVFPIVGQALVEGTVFLGSDVLRVTSPDGLGLVELLVLDGLLLDLLGLLGLFFLLIIDLLDFGLILGVFLFGLLLILDLLLTRSD
jgi:hypothetical protein